MEERRRDVLCVVHLAENVEVVHAALDEVDIGGHTGGCAGFKVDVLKTGFDDRGVDG